MAIRRGARFPPSYMSTKRRTAYSAMPTRYPLPTSRYYDTRSEDYLLSDRVSNASFLSNYALDEGYDTAKRSRGRDAQLLRDATHAIVTSESFATPQASVAARRVARGQSMVPRAASAPPRPLSVEVDPWAVQDRYQIDPYYDYTTSATIPDFYDYPQPVRARRPMVVYARQGPVVLDRAHSVPPALYYQEREKRQRMQSLPPSLPVPPVPLRVWPGFRRATSVPFDVVVPPVRSRRPYPVYERGVSIDVEPVRRGRLYPVYERRRSYVGLPYQAVQSVPLLPSLGLSAHKMPRRYLSRYPVRTVFGGFQGYYNPMSWVRRRPEDNAGKSGMRPRVLASPLARASLGRAWGRVLHSSDPFRATLVPAQETVYGFPDLLFYPRVGRKPSNRAKAAIIASKMEPDPIKRRRPRSEYAAKKYRALNMDAKEGVFTKVPRSSGLYASNPPLRKQRK